MSLRAAGVLLLAAAAAVAADPVEELLFRARHAHEVQGDLELAVRLYREALEDRSLGRARQAELHLRLALCYEELKQPEKALDPHLNPRLYEAPEVPADLRRLAEETRLRVAAQVPKPAPPEPPRRDPEEARRARVEEALREARRFLDSGDEMRALVRAKLALDLDPDNAAAREIDAELERRLSGMSDFIRDPLRFVRKWTETRVKQVAAKAQESVARGAAEAEAKRWNLAEAAFREALRTIDDCELGADSDRLVELRLNVVARWEAVHRAAYGRPLEPEVVAPPDRAGTPLADYLNQLQNLLDLVSSEEHEYRLVPVRAPRTPTGAGWQRTPEAMSLFLDLPSEWSPPLFARLYLPLRVEPESWAERGNFLEAVGDMLVARNSPKTLDALMEEVRRMERPEPAELPARFLLVSVPREALERMAAEFGAFQVAERGRDAVLFRVIPARFGLEYLCSYLRDLGADVRPAYDTFALDIANGAPRTLFAAMPLARAAAYRDAGKRAAAAHFGLALDVYPLRDRTGRTATGMRLLARSPAPPLTADTPRFVTQEAELFADLPAASTLVVAGLLDPFATARSGGTEGRELLLLWHNADTGTPEERPAEGFPGGAEVSLRALLLEQRDFPGPQVDATRGLVAPETLAVLEGRAAFLERFLRAELGVEDAAVDVEEAVLRVPPARREDAAQVVAAMERESARSYVVDVHTRAVRSQVLARWLAREGLTLAKLDGAEYAVADAPDGDILLRNLDPVEPEDVFAPRGEWPKPTALGLQARHLLSSRTRTSPAYASEEDLATGETRTVTEGLRVTVRPYTWRGNTLRIELDLESCALEAAQEEKALSLAIPSHRTRFSGTRVRGTIDLGHPDAPRTALVCRIPHPTASRADRLVEIVVTLSVRRLSP